MSGWHSAPGQARCHDGAKHSTERWGRRAREWGECPTGWRAQCEAASPWRLTEQRAQVGRSGRSGASSQNIRARRAGSSFLDFTNKEAKEDHEQSEVSERLTSNGGEARQGCLLICGGGTTNYHRWWGGRLALPWVGVLKGLHALSVERTSEGKRRWCSRWRGFRADTR